MIHSASWGSLAGSRYLVVTRMPHSSPLEDAVVGKVVGTPSAGWDGATRP